jgi:hypothetical protein
LGAAAFLAFADHLARLSSGPALADAGGVLAVDEAVLFDAADRDLDDTVPVFADDRLLGDDVGDVMADRLVDFFPVAQPVSGAAVAPLRRGGIVGAEDGVQGSLKDLKV